MTTPELCFYDTGLLCYLTGIRDLREARRQGRVVPGRVVPWFDLESLAA